MDYFVYMQMSMIFRVKSNVHIVMAEGHIMS